MQNQIPKALFLVFVPVGLFYWLHATNAERIRAQRPVAISLGRVRDNNVEKVGLRAISKQLSLHPQSVQVKVMWRATSAKSTDESGYMFYNRPESILDFVPGANQRFQFRGRGCSIDANTVHVWAKQGAIQGFCATQAD